jgi:hypothetical protein
MILVDYIVIFLHFRILLTDVLFTFKTDDTIRYGMSLFELDRMHSNVVVKLYRTDFLLLFILTRLWVS